MHWCANLVCQAEGAGSAVLLRAIEPLKGVGVMRARRRTEGLELLCAGPGRLCQALGITRPGLDGRMMEASPVVVLARDGVSRRAVSTKSVAAREHSRG